MQTAYNFLNKVLIINGMVGFTEWFTDCSAQLKRGMVYPITVTGLMVGIGNPHETEGERRMFLGSGTCV